MNCKIMLNNNLGYKWYHETAGEKSVWVKGFIIYEGGIYRERAFSEFILTADEDTLKERLASADGQFSIVIEKASRVLAFVDHMRSFPILLVKTEEHYIVTDSVDQDFIQSVSIDELQKEFLLNALFTFDDATLYDSYLIDSNDVIRFFADNSKSEVLDGCYYWNISKSKLIIDFAITL